MTWLRIDDDMLDHEKWRRAVREGGDETVAVWLRLTSWCSRRLTDGRIPAELVSEIAQLERSKRRTRALRVLVECGLCTRHVDGAIVIHGYLERNPSRSDTLHERGRRAEAQKNRRVRPNVTGLHLSSDRQVNPSVTESRPVPSRPVPSLSNEREEERAPGSDSGPDPATESGTRNRIESAQPPKVPGLVVVAHPGPLPPSRWDQTGADPPKGVRYEYDPGWAPTKANQARGHELGLTDEEIWARWETTKDKHYDRPFRDDERQFHRELAWAAADKTKNSFQNRQARNDFETPGHRRRA